MENLNAKKNIHIEHLISCKLKELGVPASLTGYRYLKTGLSDALADPSILDNLSRVFYPHVANKCNSSPSRVERAIRNSVEVSWARGDVQVQHKYFGNTINTTSFKPTNKEFLHTILEAIREELEEVGMI